MGSDLRYLGLMDWARKLGTKESALAGLVLPAQSLAPDASTRRFFRAQVAAGTVILMDAPPETENNHQFARLASWYKEQGLNVPVIYAADFEAGYFAVSDLGQQTYLDVLQQAPSSADDLYQDAMRALLRLIDAPRDSLPDYSQERFQDELDLFKHWYVEAWLEIEVPAGWSALCSLLLETINQQPKVCVHRDFHSRNLMVLDDLGNPGIVDYQDTLFGPLTYDIASLLWDCYVDWPEAICEERLEAFRQLLVQQNKQFDCSPALFRRWAVLTASQRHLKALGIFARLQVQAGRSGYLPYMPRMLAYLEHHLGDVHEEFARWLATQVRPRMESRLADMNKANNTNKANKG